MTILSFVHGSRIELYFDDILLTMYPLHLISAFSRGENALISCKAIPTIHIYNDIPISGNSLIYIWFISKNKM